MSNGSGEEIIARAKSKTVRFVKIFSLRDPTDEEKKFGLSERKMRVRALKAVKHRRYEIS